jgi:hypothetical protein
VTIEATAARETIDAGQATTGLSNVLKSQYHASLAMLRECVEKCPDELWFDESPKNAYWRVAYHALFFTQFYLGRDADSFTPWAEHQRGTQNDDGIVGTPDPTSDLPPGPDAYSRDQVLRYSDFVDAMVDNALDAMDLRRGESGFYWYKMPKLEHQLVNLRHLAHHTAQLADRLRAAEGVGIRWVGARKPAVQPQSSANA